MTHDASPPAHWSDDPLEVDRTLDAELDAGVLAARRAEAARDPDLARRLATRAAFLDALREEGVRWRAARHTPTDLEARVRRALRTQTGDAAPRGRVLRWMAAAAALLLVGVGAAAWLDGGPRAEAMPPEVLRAVDAARTSAADPQPCNDEGATSPRSFPPVREGVLRVWRCIQDERGTVAKLYRPQDLPSIGYAAVAEHGAGQGPDIGLTEIGDMVVFDVAYGSQRHFLAVERAWYEHQDRITPGRASCVACHNRSRDGQANPHAIVKRQWVQQR